jgi:AraC-like DNA-binding protein
MRDILTDVLATLQLHSTIYCQSEIYKQDWALHFKRVGGAAFHIVSEGGCWFLRDDERFQIKKGDLIILPHGHAHTIADAPDTPVTVAIHLDDEHSDSCQLLRWGNEQISTVLVCGTFQFGKRNVASVLSLLPPLLYFSADVSRGNGLKAAVDALIDEANSERQGKLTILHRLADILFVQAIRAWLANPGAEARGWLAGLCDPQIATALAAIHAEPARDWTVMSLAAQCAMSRSAFAARFTELIEASPIEYLTNWRMQLATQLLAQPSLSITQVASRVGYTSDIAFSKAFKRRCGLSPAAYRRLNK